jgi:DNA-directed RNA polymerase specialized sigma24 family protein
VALIHEHLRRRLARWLYHRLPGLTPHDLADVWSETLLAVLKAARAGRFDPGRPLLPWLGQILYVRAVDALRRVTGRRGALEAAAGSLVDTRAGRRWLGLEPWEQDEVQRVVQEAVAALKPGSNQRLVLGVFVAHYPETADLAVLRRLVCLEARRVLTAAEVKTALQGGRTTLRAILRRRGYGPGEERRCDHDA